MTVPACPPGGLADGDYGRDAALLVTKNLILTQISGFGDARGGIARLNHDILPVISLDGKEPCGMLWGGYVEKNGTT